MDSLVVLRRGDFVALRDAILTIKGGRFYEKLRSGTRAKAFVYRTWLCHYVLGFRLPWHHWTMTTNPRRPSGRLFCVHFDLCSAYPRASTYHAADWAHSRSSSEETPLSSAGLAPGIRSAAFFLLSPMGHAAHRGPQMRTDSAKNAAQGQGPSPVFSSASCLILPMRLSSRFHLIGRQCPDEVPLPGGLSVVVPRGPPLHMEEVVDETQFRVAAVL